MTFLTILSYWLSDGSGFAVPLPVVQQTRPPLKRLATQAAQDFLMLLVDALHVQLHTRYTGEHLGASFHRALDMVSLRVFDSHVPPEQYLSPEWVTAHGAGVPDLRHVRGQVSRVVTLHVESFAAGLANVSESQQVLGAHVHRKPEPGHKSLATLVTHMVAPTLSLP